ncbi:hypothetical protein N9L68_05200 [bacterium]|nr:hypothetical protein [bacterium]
MHESLSKRWQSMCYYDQIDASNLVTGEMLVRQLQRIKEKHRDRLDRSFSVRRRQVHIRTPTCTLAHDSLDMHRLPNKHRVAFRCRPL